MIHQRRFMLGALAGLVSLGLSACAGHEKKTETASSDRPGTFEESGRSVDESVDQTQEHMERQQQDTQDTIDKARKDTGDYIEQTGEDTNKAIRGESDD